jgi:hypothetical protein
MVSPGGRRAHGLGIGFFNCFYKMIIAILKMLTIVCVRFFRNYEGAKCYVFKFIESYSDASLSQVRSISRSEFGENYRWIVESTYISLVFL